MRLQKFVKARRNGNPEFDELVAKNEDNVIMYFTFYQFQKTTSYFALVINNNIVCYKREYPIGGYRNSFRFAASVEKIDLLSFWKTSKQLTHNNNVSSDYNKLGLLKEQLLVESI